MAIEYSYYLVYYAKGSGDEIATNVYAANEDSASLVGAALLTTMYGMYIPKSGVSVKLVDGLSSNTATTT